jgi:ribonuclease HI
MVKKQKYYVVWKGRQTGVFTSWEECSAQVNGFQDAQFKSFDSKDLAEQAFGGEYTSYITPKQPRVPKTLTAEQVQGVGTPIAHSYAVDAACSGNPGLLEYQCVHTQTKEPVFRRGPYANGTNNIGEFLAIVHALALFKQRRITVPIYSDSTIAIGWIAHKRCGTRLVQRETNSELFDMIERAEKWLAENDYDNRIIKWETEVWGEIPADFGRK